MKVRFYNIVWDTDGEAVELPVEVEMVIEDDGVDIAEDGADLLSNTYGWCVVSFEFEII